MKTTFALAGIALALCSMAPAQDSTQRVVVPAQNSTRPRKVTVHSNNGSITVKASNGKEVIVETSGGRDGRPATTPDGLRRIDGPRGGVNIEAQDNQIVVNPGISHGDLTISVPPDTSLNLHTLHGAITVEGVHGEIEVETLNGRANLTNVSGNVLANSNNGQITVSMDRVDTSKPLSFATLNGTIDVTMPADWKANVKLNTWHGAVYSDFDFKLGGGGVITQGNNTGDGRYKVKVDNTIVGSINGGGPEATFKTLNGNIYIRKKK
jgi:DUF4097 and DUF4098 domain-containing protein YvlB